MIVYDDDMPPLLLRLSYYSFREKDRRLGRCIGHILTLVYNTISKPNINLKRMTPPPSTASGIVSFLYLYLFLEPHKEKCSFSH
jgi:hypothetical protein